jgi:hypothetical protein
MRCQGKDDSYHLLLEATNIESGSNKIVISRHSYIDFTGDIAGFTLTFQVSEYEVFLVFFQ